VQHEPEGRLLGQSRGRELLRHREEGVGARLRLETREEARAELFKYIEVWYNRERQHSSLGYLSPAEYDEIQE